MAKETKVIQGVRVSIDPGVFNDYRVAKKMVHLQSIIESDENDPTVLIDFDDLANLIFGKRQFERIQNQLAKENGGILPANAVFEFFNSAVSEFAPKNS